MTYSDANLSDNGADEGMAEAVPVQEQQTMQNATPVLASGQCASTSSKGDKAPKRGAVLTGAAALAFGFVLVLGLVLGLAIQEESADPKDANSSPIDASYEAFAEELTLQELPLQTLKALKDPTSPQSMAYDWLMRNPMLEVYPEWQKTQRFALATFYYSTGGQGWDLQDRWLNNSMPECDWFFRSIIGSPQEIGAFGDQVTNYQVEYAESACDKEGRYRVLVFPNNNLKGHLPPELSLLSASLEVLRISENELEAPIPTQVGLLTHLKRLYTEANALTSFIPTELGLLSQLEELDLGCNPFCGGIPTELGQLSDSLKLLSIKRSGVKGSLPTELYLLTNLEIMFVNGNEGLTGAALTPGIANMKKLQRFIACQVPYASPIPSELDLLTDLWEVNFWGTQVSGSIPSEIWQLTNMQCLDLANNFLSGTFPSELIRFTGLKQTYLDANHFTGLLPGESFQNLGQLTLLKISDNLISGSIPSQVGLLTNMERLMLNYNHQLTGTLPTDIAKLTNLGELLLHDTSIAGTLPPELGSLSTLELLVVAITSLTGRIPQDLCPRVVDYECECYWHLGLFEICWDKLKPVKFTCAHSQFCGCDCGACS